MAAKWFNSLDTNSRQKRWKEISFLIIQNLCLTLLLGECPDGWLNAGELGGCYLFAPNGPGLNWQQSVAYCASNGGFLTDILNQETETFLENSGFVQSNPNVRWWIGGNDIAQVSTIAAHLRV